MAKNTALRPYMLTLTVKNGHDLPERFNHLHSSMKKFMKRRRDFLSARLGSSQLAKSEGGVFSYELTKSKFGWHPHCHMVVMLDPQNPIDFPFHIRPVFHSLMPGLNFLPWRRKTKRLYVKNILMRFKSQVFAKSGKRLEVIAKS